jgi:hypothetical protein
MLVSLHGHGGQHHVPCTKHTGFQVAAQGKNGMIAGATELSPGIERHEHELRRGGSAKGARHSGNDEGSGRMVIGRDGVAGGNIADWPAVYGRIAREALVREDDVVHGRQGG